MSDNSGKDSVITWDEFVEYYNNISCSYDTDEMFAFMVEKCWFSKKNFKKAYMANIKKW